MFTLGPRFLEKFKTERNIRSYIEDELSLTEYELIGRDQDLSSENKDVWTVEADMPDGIGHQRFHVWQDKMDKSNEYEYSTDSDLFGCLNQIMCGEYEGWTDDFFIEKTEEKITCTVVQNIKNREDFKKARDNMTELCAFLEDTYPEVMKMHGYIEYIARDQALENSNIGNISNLCHEEIEYSLVPDNLKGILSTTNKLTRDENLYYFISSCLKITEKHYVRNGLMYGLLDRLDEYSPEEREVYMYDGVYPLFINETGDTQIPEKSTGYACVTFQTGFSYSDWMGYGTLFYVLQTCGYETKGTWNDFSFKGIDGEIYSFHYRDCDYKNVYPIVNANKIQEVTGIKVKEITIENNERWRHAWVVTKI
jgi:hypothetical protein